MEISLTQFSYRVPINSIQTVSRSPAILALSGQQIGNARTVLINGVEVRYEAQTEGTILVEVPVSVASTGIESIVVQSSGPVAVTDAVSVTFSFDEMLPTMSGLSALVQRFLKVLLTSKNTSYLNMDEGGGILSMVASSDGESLAKGLLVDAVTNTEKYLKDDPKFIELPPSERLASAEVLSVGWDRNSQTASLSIRVTNQLGETVESGVSL